MNSRLRMILLLVCLCWATLGFTPAVSSTPHVRCIVVDVEFVNCTWSDHEPEQNFSLKSMFTHYDLMDCVEYHKVNGFNVGCRFPYLKGQRFNEFHTLIYNSLGASVKNETHDLKNKVKLFPPVNLRLRSSEEEEGVLLSWSVSAKTGSDCIHYEVQHRTDNSDWTAYSPSTQMSFSLPWPSKKHNEFRVRSRLTKYCGESMFWSDWSESAFWKSPKPNNSTEPIVPSVSVRSVLLYVIGPSVLIALICLLIHCERLRIIFIPLPKAGQNVSRYLTTFFDNYDGNAEKWLSISKDLEKGFTPNLTERACPVSEYVVVSQSSSDSESIISMPTDVSSDYQCMSSLSSTSTELWSSHLDEPP